MGRKLYVGNLPYDTDETQLQSMFAQAGTVDTVSVVRDKMTGRARGFAFVEMSSDDEAQAAIKQFNNADLGGRRQEGEEQQRQRLRRIRGCRQADGREGRGGDGRSGDPRADEVAAADGIVGTAGHDVLPVQNAPMLAWLAQSSQTDFCRNRPAPVCLLQ